jgi:Aerobic-type carbon monoxide dehydrogenase, large subunit CoxL/CutL homologs
MSISGVSKTERTPQAEDAPEEAESFTGQGLPRVEDHRILAGEAKYVHDLTPDDCLHLALVRSMHAHANIVDIDTSEAEAHPDCELVLTADDIQADYNPMPTGITEVQTEQGTGTLTEWSLAAERVRFVGEPVVAVAASNRYAAEDVADLVNVTYEPLEPVTDGMTARTDDTVIHESAGTNVVDHEHLRFGDVDDAFAEADHVVEGEYFWGRISGVPLETAGVLADYDADTDSFDIDCNIQLHTLVDDTIYDTLGYGPNDVRVNVPPMWVVVLARKLRFIGTVAWRRWRVNSSNGQSSSRKIELRICRAEICTAQSATTECDWQSMKMGRCVDSMCGLLMISGRIRDTPSTRCSNRFQW